MCPPLGPRTFFLSDYACHQHKALAYLHTDAFHHDMRLRPAIERIIACLVRYHGARHAHGYGLANANYQAHMAAMAFMKCSPSGDWMPSGVNVVAVDINAEKVCLIDKSSKGCTM